MPSAVVISSVDIPNLLKVTINQDLIEVPTTNGQSVPAAKSSPPNYPILTSSARANKSKSMPPSIPAQAVFILGMMVQLALSARLLRMVQFPNIPYSLLIKMLVKSSILSP